MGDYWRWSFLEAPGDASEGAGGATDLCGSVPCRTLSGPTPGPASRLYGPRGSPSLNPDLESPPRSAGAGSGSAPRGPVFPVTFAQRFRLLSLPEPGGWHSCPP